MKKVINKGFLSTIISGVSFIDVDGAEDVFRDVDYNDELEMKKVIRYRLFVDYCSYNKKAKACFKNTLASYLSNDVKNEEYMRIFEVNFPSLNLPDNPRLFFVWMWEEFYGKESYIIDDFSMYHIDKTSWLVLHMMNKNKKSV